MPFNENPLKFTTIDDDGIPLLGRYRYRTLVMAPWHRLTNIKRARQPHFFHGLINKWKLCELMMRLFFVFIRSILSYMVIMKPFSKTSLYILLPPEWSMKPPSSFPLYYFLLSCHLNRMLQTAPGLSFRSVASSRLAYNNQKPMLSSFSLFVDRFLQYHAAKSNENLDFVRRSQWCLDMSKP